MGWMRKLPNSTAFWLSAVAIVLVCSILLPVVGWDWLRSGASESGGESNSTTIRNVGFLIAGVLALVFAVWRGVLAQRQAMTAERQSETSQQGLLNERYQKGADMLGSATLPVRLGGIYALRRLAWEHPEQYHIQVMRLLCAFVRLPPPNNEIKLCPQVVEGQSERILELRPDVQDAMKAIAQRGSAGILMESREEDNTIYLRDAQLMGLQLSSANLSNAWLTNASLSRAVLPYVDLSGARLRLADLSGAELRHSNLSDADFWGANLCGTALRNANISGADFCGIRARSSLYRTPARGLTQTQLDEALAYTGNPPYLEGVLDAETGKQLVWRGKAPDAGSQS